MTISSGGIVFKHREQIPVAPNNLQKKKKGRQKAFKTEDSGYCHTSQFKCDFRLEKSVLRLKLSTRTLSGPVF